MKDGANEARLSFTVAEEVKIAIKGKVKQIGARDATVQATAS